MCCWAGGDMDGKGYGDDDDWNGDCMGLNPTGIDRDWSRGAGADENGLRKLGDCNDIPEAEDD